MAKKKRKKKDNKRILWLVIVVFAGVVLSHFMQAGNTTPPEHYSNDLAVPAGSDNQIIVHKGFTLSYNNDTRNPDWVGYELTDEEVKEAVVQREEDFYCDPLVRGTQATDEDYRKSGWDRGHIAPAADMKWSKQAMQESFYLSNVSPQNKNLNRGAWKKLEELCRDKAELYGKVIIVAGPLFKGKKAKTIGNNKVRVPDAFFKVLLTYYGNKYHAIGFIFDNKTEKKKLAEYARSIDEIEKESGFDFFYQLPDEEEKEIEKTYSTAFWGVL